MSLPPIAAWNVRGFNNPVKVKLCRDLIAAYRLKLLCILEAKIQSNVAQDPWFLFSHSLFENEKSFDNFSCSSPGRIWIKWDSAQISFTPLSASSQVIHGIVQAGSFPPIYLSAVYAGNDLVDRKELWENLLGFSANLEHPWVVMGDFNCCRFQNEKAGGNLLTGERLGELNSFVFESGLHDLASVGLFYTWHNQRSDNPIHIKLDRMLVNTGFLDVFPSAYYKIDPPTGSDHSPIILFAAHCNRTFSRFMFKVFWTNVDEFWVEVLKAFSRPVSASPIAFFYDCLKELKGAIRAKDWSSSNYISKGILEMKSLQQQCINAIQLDPLNHSLNCSLKEANTRLASLNSDWVSWISQRAKAYWLSQGEDDLGFLYAKIRSRKNRNTINEISTSTGTLSSHEDLAHVLISHFKELYNSNPPPLESGYVIPEGNKVPNALIPSLVSPVTEEEIKAVVFEGVSYSAPGPDGFSFAFYQKTWHITHILGIDLCRAVKQFFSTACLALVFKFRLYLYCLHMRIWTAVYCCFMAGRGLLTWDDEMLQLAVPRRNPWRAFGQPGAFFTASLCGTSGTWITGCPIPGFHLLIWVTILQSFHAYAVAVGE
ncbi:uncharacterized protein LOC110116364, partial [Dendrobium catenatum]|uniref:uncharacterized protein LOC110116364 n=1 Tax=Dendrobium catenatum TaxID=906689 RepID=UPI00109F3BD1